MTMIRKPITVDDQYGVLQPKFWDYLYEGELVEINVKAGNVNTDTLDFSVHVENRAELDLLIESVKNIIWLQWGIEGDDLYVELNVLPA